MSLIKSALIITNTIYIFSLINSLNLLNLLNLLNSLNSLNLLNSLNSLNLLNLPLPYDYNWQDSRCHS